MEIICETKKDIEIVKVKGRLDATNAADFEKDLITIIERNPKALVIDMEGLDYISSAGLRTLLLGAKLLKNKDRILALCGLRETVKEVFDIAGFTELFPIYESEEEGLKEIASS